MTSVEVHLCKVKHWPGQVLFPMNSPYMSLAFIYHAMGCDNPYTIPAVLTAHSSQHLRCPWLFRYEFRSVPRGIPHNPWRSRHRHKPDHTAVQSLKAVTAHFSSKQLLPFGFAERHTSHVCFSLYHVLSLPSSVSHWQVSVASPPGPYKRKPYAI